MKKWFIEQPLSSRLGLTLLTFSASLFLIGNGVGLMMGDPMTEDAQELQRRWAPVAFFLGCPAGLALVVLGITMIVWCFDPKED